jgi:membrane protein
MRIAQGFSLLKDSYAGFAQDKAARLGAALAYYTIFSIPSLLILLIGAAGLLFGRQAVEGEVVGTLGGLIGPQGAKAIQDMLRSMTLQNHGTAATVIGVVSLALGASGVFGQLKDALDTIWEVQPKPGRGVMAGILGYLRGNLTSVVTLVGTAFLLVASLVVNTAVSALGHWFSRTLPGGEALWHVVNFVLTLAALTIMFGLMFKYVPDVKIKWRDVWVGAVVTAILFTIGEWLIGFYLGRTNVGSAFGAAGSLIVMLVWIYYSAQIFFFGVEYTKAYAARYGSRIVPDENAMPVGESQRRQEGIPRDNARAPRPQPGGWPPEAPARG